MHGGGHHEERDSVAGRTTAGPTDRQKQEGSGHLALGHGGRFCPDRCLRHRWGDGENGDGEHRRHQKGDAPADGDADHREQHPGEHAGERDGALFGPERNALAFEGGHPHQHDVGADLHERVRDSAQRGGNGKDPPLSGNGAQQAGGGCEQRPGSEPEGGTAALDQPARVGGDQRSDPEVGGGGHAQACCAESELLVERDDLGAGQVEGEHPGHHVQHRGGHRVRREELDGSSPDCTRHPMENTLCRIWRMQA